VKFFQFSRRNLKKIHIFSKGLVLGHATEMPDKEDKVPRLIPACLIGCATYDYPIAVVCMFFDKQVFQSLVCSEEKIQLSRFHGYFKARTMLCGKTLDF
jgi:hypothetical protein